MKKINKNIFTLGFVSLLSDISSEMIYPLLPVFLSSVLGVGIGFIGLIEGIAESTASILKTFSGWFSDKLKKRKPLILTGYSLSAIGKPFLYLATLGWHVLAVRFVDRVGKGIRTAPRDALIADSSSQDNRGKSFGLQRAMDNIGAFLGPLAAFLLLSVFPKNYRLVFLLAFIPALISIFIIIFFLKEKRALNTETGKTTNPNLISSFKSLNKDFKIFILIVSIFTLGNSSDAFLILKAKDLGLKLVMIPIFWMAFNFFTSISAYPMGHLSDKIGRKKTIIIGFVLYAIVYKGFAISSMQYHIWILIALYGLYYGLSEGVLKAYIADIVPESSKRGTAYGIFNTAVGIFMFPASFLMGIFWQVFGSAFAFSFGAALALISVLLFVILQSKKD